MRKNTQQKKSSQAIWPVSGVAVVAVAVLVALSILSSRQPSPGNEPPASSVASDGERGAARRMMGPDDATVTVTEYMNYL